MSLARIQYYELKREIRCFSTKQVSFAPEFTIKTSLIAVPVGPQLLEYMR